jgi:hypothetical protein
MSERAHCFGWARILARLGFFVVPLPPLGGVEGEGAEEARHLQDVMRRGGGGRGRAARVAVRALRGPQRSLTAFCIFHSTKRVEAGRDGDGKLPSKSRTNSWRLGTKLPRRFWTSCMWHVALGSKKG